MTATGADESSSAAGQRIDRRERIAWALVFSVPPGIGIAIATAKVSFGSLTDPIVVAAFAVTTVVMFAIVYGAATVNQPEPDPTRTARESTDSNDQDYHDLADSDRDDGDGETRADEIADERVDTEAGAAGEETDPGDALETERGEGTAADGE